MGFKNIISSILTTFLFPNKVFDVGSDVCSRTQCTSQAAPECPVCLSSLRDEMGTRVLPCQHEFHDICVGTWLAVPHFKNTCPICRFSMEEDCRDEGDDDHEVRRQQECFTEEMVIWFSSFHVTGF